MFSSQCVHDGRSVNPYTLSRALDRHPLQVFYSLPYMKVEHDVLFLLSGVSHSSQYTYAIQCTYYIARNNIYIYYVSCTQKNLVRLLADCRHRSSLGRLIARICPGDRSGDRGYRPVHGRKDIFVFRVYISRHEHNVVHLNNTGGVIRYTSSSSAPHEIEREPRGCKVWKP